MNPIRAHTWREGGREGGREWREGGREGSGRREGGREGSGRREGGREGGEWREGGRERGREGGREGGEWREGGRGVEGGREGSGRREGGKEGVEGGSGGREGVEGGREWREGGSGGREGGRDTEIQWNLRAQTLWDQHCPLYLFRGWPLGKCCLFVFKGAQYSNQAALSDLKLQGSFHVSQSSTVLGQLKQS